MAKIDTCMFCDSSPCECNRASKKPAIQQIKPTLSVLPVVPERIVIPETDYDAETRRAITVIERILGPVLVLDNRELFTATERLERWKVRHASRP